MCGIVGLYSIDSCNSGVLDSVVRHMTDRLHHRGPDDSGIWIDTENGLALGHRRLSILDISSSGHQPMHSACGRYVIVYNGEIYNHLDLRRELSYIPYSPELVWKGRSDTETLLAGFSQWGIEETLTRAVGMFSFALWDRINNTLTLARDRFGEKPLYYGWVGNSGHKAFVFASELKALTCYPGFDSVISHDALTQYFRFLYVPAPLSIYEGIFKIEPGCLLTLKIKEPHRTVVKPIRPGQVNGNITIRRWWSLVDTVVSSKMSAFVDEKEALWVLENQLKQSVGMQTLSDVPLGAFLSGGVDSSAIVALMQSQSSRPVKTFTIGFDEGGYDESSYARAVANHLGTEHHELRISPQMSFDVISTLPSMYDEPFADSSQIPTNLVCKAASQHVTVALSGDAGDELFGGYNRYVWGPSIWRKIKWMPFSMRQNLFSTLRKLPLGEWTRLSSLTRISRLGEKVQKLADKVESARDLDDLYWSLVSEWKHPNDLIVASQSSKNIDVRSITLSGIVLPDHLRFEEKMMLLDTLTYLPDDILCKLDRAGMATSLETRVPFLDHRVVELAWRLPFNMRIRGNKTKWALRQVLYKHVPTDLIERPKTGFSIPLAKWLRGPLREWVETMLSEDTLTRQGYLNPKIVKRTMEEHMSGRRDHATGLWSILMFQSWLQGQRNFTHP